MPNTILPPITNSFQPVSLNLLKGFMILDSTAANIKYICAKIQSPLSRVIPSYCLSV